MNYLGQFCNTTIIYHYMIAIRYHSSECALFHFLCRLWLHWYVLAAASFSCSFFWDGVLCHLCTTKHNCNQPQVVNNCNQPQVVSWLKSVVTVIPAHYSSTQSMLQFTLHAKCEIGLWIIVLFKITSRTCPYSSAQMWNILLWRSFAGKRKHE
jgi:hypothetical protein